MSVGMLGDYYKHAKMTPLLVNKLTELYATIVISHNRFRGIVQEL